MPPSCETSSSQAAMLMKPKFKIPPPLPAPPQPAPPSAYNQFTSSFPEQSSRVTSKSRTCQPDFKQPARNTSPTDGPPLWEQVKSAMDSEKLFRHKSEALTISNSRLKQEKRELKNDIAKKQRTIADKNSTISTLTDGLASAEEELKTEKQQHAELLRKYEDGELYQTNKLLLEKITKSQIEVRKFKTALKAAFNLVEDIGKQTTYDRILELTEERLQMRLSANKAKEETESRTMRRETAPRDVQDVVSGEDEDMLREVQVGFLADSALPRETKHTPAGTTSSDNPTHGSAQEIVTSTNRIAGDFTGSNDEKRHRCFRWQALFGNTADKRPRRPLTPITCPGLDTDSDDEPLAKRTRRLTQETSPRKIIWED
ncbi:hypothetical protein QQS21_011444 [Conoideocrella luteorostrata]|uniref:Uncharacterized protein n=1 Tax=Conoideocrella luteorostrata TaxID=1105319 RepID=A0AAJ0CD37_9HYPO|nr:hypothetical protein QQS21_011444 [Conoideocrella luteorostrata]